MSSGKRPEHLAPPDIFYSESEAQKYATNSRMIEIQSAMASRAIELLALPADRKCCSILDLGCGSGLSGEAIEEDGHHWVGLDISQAMLDIAVDRGVEGGDVMLGDLGQGLPFRAGSFDGAISISALQWLCNADKSHHSPHKRLARFFTSLYACLSHGSRAVFQFYPENAQQIDMITIQSTKAGFGGGLVIDFPNSTKAKKYFLVLATASYGPDSVLPDALGVESGTYRSTTVRYSGRAGEGGVRCDVKTQSARDWILAKKERRRKKGKNVRPDSRFTGRKRSGRL